VTSFYVRDGAKYVSTPSTVGPWDPKLQHGSPVASLLATRIEHEIAPHTRIAHFSMDFWGAVPVATLDVTTAIERPGKKIELRSATVSAFGKTFARANAWVLQTKPNVSDETHLDDPPPPMPEKAVTTYFESVPRFGYGDALEWRFPEGSFVEIGPATVWSKLRVAIVEGEDVSPLARALAMVDSANGISAELDVRTHLFVPVNLTVSMTREPEGEWVGMRAVTSLARDGVGTTRARLFDSRGTIGRALQTIFVERRS
jgi:Thioesterase-like superfamily